MEGCGKGLPRFRLLIELLTAVVTDMDSGRAAVL